MKTMLLAALFAALALPVAAQTPAKLEAGETQVQAREDKAKSDAKVTTKERAKLAKAQSGKSRKINKRKHDAQVAK